MTINIIVANDKGGVGKSTLAQMCVLHVGKTFREVRAVEYDRQPKLGRFFDKGFVQTFSIAPDWHTQMSQPQRLAEHWDPMIKWLTVKRPLVADFGAQVWDYFASWAEESSLGDLVDTGTIVVLVPYTADLEAISAAQRIVERAPAALPRCRVVLLSSDKDGEMALLQRHPAMVALREAAARAGAETLALPRLVAEGYPALAAFGQRFDTICGAKPNDLVKAAGLPPATAVRTIKGVKAWVGAMTAMLDGIVAPAAPRRKGAPTPETSAS